MKGRTMMERSLMIAVCISSAVGLLPIAAAGSGAVQAAEAAKLVVAEKDPIGEYLTDAAGKSLYLFEADSENTSTCYDDCVEAWPPQLTEGAPTGDDKVEASMLSTIARKDGSIQDTYKIGWENG